MKSCLAEKKELHSKLRENLRPGQSTKATSHHYRALFNFA